MTGTRIPTAVDTVADSYLDDWAVLDPSVATYFGIPGHDDRLPALTPEWYASVSELRRHTLSALESAVPVDANDRITVAALREELGVREELRAAGVEESDLKNIASPLQNIRDTFDLMPLATLEDWETVATRLRAVPDAVDGYVESLRFAAKRGDVVARRQVSAGIAQSNDNVGPEGFFANFARTAALEGHGEIPAALRADLAVAAQHASDGYARL
ncbi:MAG: DUF885 domain-containing protein, partial [Actinomycetota bacterium]|nr:DUF885 domain-containing protein [Actinomycetota bacterium]